ncbi:ribonuclease H-like domain-containing protein [Tanacetum coccineum]
MRDLLGMFLPQHKCVTEILKRAGMVGFNPFRTHVDIESKLGADGYLISDPTLYRNLASALHYLTFTRPDVSFIQIRLVALPLIEAEYRGVANAIAETCSLRNLLRELHTPLSLATLVYCDNVSDVYLSSNPVQHQCTKHIEINIHFVCDLVVVGQHDDIGSSSKLNLSLGDTLYSHPNDTGGSPIVTIKLTRTENYKIWSIAMTFALRNHNKLGFIDGYCKRYNKNHALANQWNMSFEMWSDLKETYDKVDGSAVFNLHKNINSLSQNGSSLVEYYNNLNSLWKQFDAMISLSPCTYDASTHFKKHNHLIKLMQFLMGLDKSYLVIRSNILTREPLPLAKAAFVVASGEESHRNAILVGTTKPTATAFAAKTFDNKRRFNNNNNFNKGSSLNSNNKGPNPNLKCTNCNKISHIVDRCFELVGDPAGYVKRNFNANTRHVSSNNVFADVHYNNTTIDTRNSNSPVSLSNEQLSQTHGENKTVGIGNQCNGLYMFDVDNAFKIVSNNCIASWRVFKYLSHQRLGHHADQMLDVLKSSLNLDSQYVSDHLLSYDSQNDRDSRATSIDENTHPKSNVSDETNLVENFYENSEFNYENVDLPVNTVRRSSGQTKLPSSLTDFIVEGKVKYGVERIDAMDAEIEALNKNHTWITTDMHANRKSIGSKWVFKIKYKDDGEIKRYKARLVAKGFNKRECIDFDETFSPIVKMSTVRCLIALSVQNKWPLFQLDVNNVFLYGDLEEDVYITIPQGFYDKTNQSKVYKLVKSLYGLRKALIKWNEKLVSVLKEHDFVQSVNDHYVFTESKDNKFIALLVYVDDIVIIGNCVNEIDQFKIFLKYIFNIKDLGNLKFFLGIEVIKTGDDICLSQRKYCLELLKEYLKKALGKRIKYVYVDSNNNLQGYCDADWAKLPKNIASSCGSKHAINYVISFNPKKGNYFFKGSYLSSSHSDSTRPTDSLILLGRFLPSVEPLQQV